MWILDDWRHGCSTLLFIEFIGRRPTGVRGKVGAFINPDRKMFLPATYIGYGSAPHVIHKEEYIAA
jgi:hypothetical protein